MSNEKANKIEFVPPKTENEAYSRKEQVLERGFGDWQLDQLELEIFGSVSPKLKTEKQLDRWLVEQANRW